MGGQTTRPGGAPEFQTKTQASTCLTRISAKVEWARRRTHTVAFLLGAPLVGGGSSLRGRISYASLADATLGPSCLSRS